MAGLRPAPDGRARLRRPLLPRGVRRPGGLLLLARPRGMPLVLGSGSLNMGLAVHTDMVLPPIEMLGAEDLKQRYLVPGIKGEKIGCWRMTENSAGSDSGAPRPPPPGAGTAGFSTGRRPSSPTARSPITWWSRRRPIPRGTTTASPLFLVERGTPGFQATRLEDLGWRPRTPASSSRRSACQPITSWARRARASTTSCRSSGGSGRSALAGSLPERTLDLEEELRRGAHGVRPPVGDLPGVAAQVRRHGHEDRRGPALTYHAPPGLVDGEDAVREVSMAKLVRHRGRLEVADEASRSTAATAT